MKDIKTFESFISLNKKEISGDDKLGNFILDALKNKFFSDMNLEKKPSTYDSELIYTFKIGIKIIKVVEVEERGVFIHVDDKKLEMESKLAVEIFHKCQEILYFII
jgi:hypothetical protein